MNTLASKSQSTVEIRAKDTTLDQNIGHAVIFMRLEQKRPCRPSDERHRHRN